jgi:hypothetical protein
VPGEQEKKSFSLASFNRIKSLSHLQLGDKKNELFDANKDLICTRGNQVI